MREVPGSIPRAALCISGAQGELPESKAGGEGETELQSFWGTQDIAPVATEKLAPGGVHAAYLRAVV